MKKRDLKKRVLAVTLTFGCVASMLLGGCGQSERNAGIKEEVKEEKQEEKDLPSDENKNETEMMVFGATRNQALDDYGIVNGCFKQLGVWESLITTDDDGSPAPELAESWESNENCTEWIFHLMDGVTFSDGEKFNADAVVDNYNRYTHGTEGLDMSNYYPGLEKVEKVDDKTVKMTFAEPIPTLLYNMTNYNSVILSPACFEEETGLLKKYPIGTGRYILKEVVMDQYVIIERNDNYYGDPAKVKNIQVKVIPDANTRYSALQAGEILGVFDLGAIQPLQAKELCKDERFEAFPVRGTLVHYLYLNGTEFPFNDYRMRKAIDLMIDRQVLVDEFYDGYGIPTTNILSNSSPFYKETPIEHNVEEAKKLAKEVLGDQRFTAKTLIRTKDISRYPYKEEAEYMQSVFAELGIDMEIEIYDEATVTDMRKQGDYSISLAMRSMPSSEPFSMLESYMASDGGNNIGQHLGYHNEHVDELIQQAKQEMDMDKRKVIYDELQDICTAELPLVSLFHEQAVYAYNKSQIKGFNNNPYQSGKLFKDVEWVK